MLPGTAQGRAKTATISINGGEVGETKEKLVQAYFLYVLHAVCLGVLRFTRAKKLPFDSNARLEEEKGEREIEFKRTHTHLIYAHNNNNIN